MTSGRRKLLVAGIGAAAAAAGAGFAWFGRSGEPAADSAALWQATFPQPDGEPLEMAGPDYATFSLPDEPHVLGGTGGLMGLPEGTPSHWLVYFQVADTDAAAAAAERAGGTVVAPAVDTPFGRLACLADPDGATSMVMTTDPAQPGPDRSG